MLCRLLRTLRAIRSLYGVTKEKITIEYVLNRISKSSLWTCLSTSNGLSEWFADTVSNQGNIFTFFWRGHSSEAELISVNPMMSIRFRWLEESPDTYFEFNIHHTELTGNHTLEIIDFADLDEIEEAIALWDSQVKILRRKLGV